jgi:hypothetical protein
MFKNEFFRSAFVLCSSVFGLMSLSVNPANSAVITRYFLQLDTNDDYFFSGSFVGSDDNSNGLLEQSELVSFNTFFNLEHNLNNLQNFPGYVIGSNTLGYFSSSKREDINNGIIDYVEEDFSASPDGIDFSGISTVTHFSDGSVVVADAFALLDSPIYVSDRPIGVPEASNLVGLLVFGGILVSLKRVNHS